jgi:serine/threonine protein kinase
VERAPLQPGDRLGPYEIVGFIAAGGMGHVYKARDTRLDRFVAIKQLTGPHALSIRPKEGLEHIERALSDDPLNIGYRHIKALCLIPPLQRPFASLVCFAIAGDIPLAIQWAKRAIEERAPGIVSYLLKPSTAGIRRSADWPGLAALMNLQDAPLADVPV